MWFCAITSVRKGAATQRRVFHLACFPAAVLLTFGLAFTAAHAQDAEGTVNYALKNQNKQVFIKGKYYEPEASPTARRHSWVLLDEESQYIEVNSASDTAKRGDYYKVTGKYKGVQGRRHPLFVADSVQTIDASSPAPTPTGKNGKTNGGGGDEKTNYLPVFAVAGVLLVGGVLWLVLKKPATATPGPWAPPPPVDMGTVYIPPNGFLVTQGGRETPGTQKRLMSVGGNYRFSIVGIHDPAFVLPAQNPPNVIQLLSDTVSSHHGEVLFNMANRTCSITVDPRATNAIRVNGAVLQPGAGPYPLKDQDDVAIGEVQLKYHVVI